MTFKSIIQSAFLLIALATTILVAGCGNDTEKKDIPDVSNVQVDVKFHRFDEALMAIDTNNVDAGWAALEKQYPVFANLFVGPIMDDNPQPNFRPQLRNFLADSEVRRVFDTIQMQFKNFEPYKKDITEGFRFYKHYFPNAPIPEIYTFFSMYRYGITPPYDGTVGVGLDFFLGEEHYAYNFVENLNYKYIKRTLTKEHLTKSLFERLVLEMSGEPQGNRLIDQMVHNGKQLYILDCLLPNAPDSIKFGYTAAQTKWVHDNEAEMWSHFLRDNLLYSTEIQKIGKLVNPSPNSPGMPPEAPGKTGNFIGYRIVRQFMKRNPNTTLEALIRLKDAQQILELSKYKPAR